MKELVQGDQGTWVTYLQLALSRTGVPIQIDGIFGDETCRYLRAFLGLTDEVLCKVTDEVWEMLVPYLTGYTIHIVERGDTFWKLTSNYPTSTQRLLTANPMVNPMKLLPGMRIVVPYDFELVTDEVDYSSQFTAWVIEGLLMRYPFLQARRIGRSVLGKDLTLLQIGTGDRQVFYSASYHANEWITTPVLLKFAEDYADHFSKGASMDGVRANWLYYGFTLYLLPLVNPDGVDLVAGTLEDEEAYARAERIASNYPEISFPDGWKANIDGIDLNLQFPAGWQEAKQIKEARGFTSPAPRDYVGERPLSAPEARAVYQFTRRRDFELILAYHTQGEVIYWKYLDYEPEDSYHIALYFAEVSGYAVEETPNISGYAGYKDWFIQEYGRPGYTIEAGMGVNPLPISQFQQIYSDNRGILLGGMTQI